MRVYSASAVCDRVIILLTRISSRVSIFNTSEVDNSVA